MNKKNIIGYECIGNDNGLITFKKTLINKTDKIKLKMDGVTLKENKIGKFKNIFDLNKFINKVYK